MSDHETIGTIAVGIMIGLILAIAGLIFIVPTWDDFQREAVSVGVAEYYLDESNTKQFRWKRHLISQEHSHD